MNEDELKKSELDEKKAEFEKLKRELEAAEQEKDDYADNVYAPAAEELAKATKEFEKNPSETTEEIKNVAEKNYNLVKEKFRQLREKYNTIKAQFKALEAQIESARSGAGESRVVQELTPDQVEIAFKLQERENQVALTEYSESLEEVKKLKAQYESNPTPENKSLLDDAEKRSVAAQGRYYKSISAFNEIKAKREQILNPKVEVAKDVVETEQPDVAAVVAEQQDAEAVYKEDNIIEPNYDLYTLEQIEEAYRLQESQYREALAEYVAALEEYKRLINEQATDYSPERKALLEAAKTKYEAAVIKYSNSAKAYEAMQAKMEQIINDKMEQIKETIVAVDEEVSVEAPKPGIAETVAPQPGIASIPKIDIDIDKEFNQYAADAGLEPIVTETQNLAAAVGTIAATVAARRGDPEPDPETITRDIVEKVEKGRKEKIAERREEAKSVDYLGEFGEIIKSGLEKGKGFIGKIFGTLGKKAKNVINAGIGEVVAAPANIKDTAVAAGKTVGEGIKTAGEGLKTGAEFAAGAIVTGAGIAVDAVATGAEFVGEKVSKGFRTIKGFVGRVSSDLLKGIKGQHEVDGPQKFVGSKESLAIQIGRGIRDSAIIATAPVWGTAAGVAHTVDFISKVPSRVIDGYRTLKIARLTRQCETLNQKQMDLNELLADKQKQLDALKNGDNSPAIVEGEGPELE